MEVKEWLEENYPKENRNGIEELNIEKKGLEGELDLSDFPNLKKLNCNSNKLTSLNIENCPNIEVIDAWNNLIEEVMGIEELIHLSELNLAKNKLKELNLVKSTKLIKLAVHDNPDLREAKIGEVSRLIRYNGGSPFNLRQFAALSWVEVIRKRLGEVAERLGIDPEQVKNSPVEKIKELVEKRIDELRESENNQKPEGLPDKWREQLNEVENLKGKIKQAEEFGLTEWDNLTNQTRNETLASLLNRPTKDELERVEKERDSRPNITSSELQKLKDNQKPDNLPPNWQELLGKIPELEKRPTLEDLNKYKNYISPEQLAANYLPKNDLKKEAEKLGMVSQEEYNKRPNITVADWNNDWSRRRPLTDYEKLQNDLSKWVTKFPNTTPEKVLSELTVLRNKPTGSILTPEQQQKINDYERVVRQKEAALKKARENMTKNEYQEFVEVNNKIR